VQTSLDQFVAPMSSTMAHESSDVINYLTLDLDEPATGGDRASSGCRGEEAECSSTTVYDYIDWFRTQALNDTRRQVETSRKNSACSGTGTGCLVVVSK